MRMGLLLAAVVLLSSGCAVSSMNHMALTNLVDRTLVPDDRTVQWVMTPLLIPVCIVTLTIDNFIIAPAVHLPSAYLDTIDFWKASVGGYYTEMGVLPFRVLLTPVVFFGDWLGRTVLALSPRNDAAWGWPEWGLQWVRDRKGRLLGPPTEFDPKTKKPLKKPSEEKR